jgi:hypothetical protein
MDLVEHEAKGATLYVLRCRVRPLGSGLGR